MAGQLGGSTSEKRGAGRSLRAVMTEPACPVCGSTRVEPYPSPYPDPLVRCRGCGTRFVHTPPDDVQLRARYDREHESGKWRGLFEVADAAEPGRRARLLGALAGGARGRRLLDVGCGDGAFLDAARSAGWRAFGTELSPAAVRAVAARHPVVVGPLAAIRPGPHFAAVTFWDMLEHLARPADTVRAASALLEPGGLVAATMPNASGTEALLHGSSWRYHDLEAYGHLVHLGAKQLAALLEAAGLEIVHLETRGSIDLRSVLGERAARPTLRPIVWALDRASGVVARVAEPAGRGNTLLVVGRAPR
jgi:2-polyprenyl-3-methyl-5-hydroxy-6-metoxy-1,4-benzoquinol methylase